MRETYTLRQLEVGLRWFSLVESLIPQMHQESLKPGNVWEIRDEARKADAALRDVLEAHRAGRQLSTIADGALIAKLREADRGLPPRNIEEARQIRQQTCGSQDVEVRLYEGLKRLHGIIASMSLMLERAIHAKELVQEVAYARTRCVNLLDSNRAYQQKLNHLIIAVHLLHQNDEASQAHGTARVITSASGVFECAPSGL